MKIEKSLTIQQIQEFIKDGTLSNMEGPFNSYISESKDSLELELPDFSKLTKLKKLDLSSCKNLPDTPENIAKLLELEKLHESDPNFTIMWPEHFIRDPKALDIKNNLNEAYRIFYKELGENIEKLDYNDKEKCPIIFLFQRFMSENTESRGGVQKVLESILPISKAIKENPHIIADLHEDLKYTDALKNCVNQPVMAMVDISIALAITQGKSIQDKIELGKGFLIIAMVREFVAKEKPGAAVEAELFNAMTSEIYEKLKSNKLIFPQDELPGVPEKGDVAYIGSVKSYLTEENINNLYKEIEQVLGNKNLEEALNILQSTKPDFWQMQILGKEYVDAMHKQITKIEANACHSMDSLDPDKDVVAIDLIGQDSKNQIHQIQEKAHKDTDDKVKEALGNKVPNSVVAQGSIDKFTKNHGID